MHNDMTDTIAVETGIIFPRVPAAAGVDTFIPAVLLTTCNLVLRPHGTRQALSTTNWISCNRKQYLICKNSERHFYFS